MKKKSLDKKRESTQNNILLKKWALEEKNFFCLKKKKGILEKQNKKKTFYKKKVSQFHKVFPPSELLFFSLGTQIQWFTVYAAKNKVISNNHNKVITVDIQILI